MRETILAAGCLAATLPPSKEIPVSPQAVQYVPAPGHVHGLVMDRGRVYRRPDSPHWMIRFRCRGRTIRESSGTGSRREATLFLQRRMSEFGLGTDSLAADIPDLTEA